MESKITNHAALKIQIEEQSKRLSEKSHVLGLLTRAISDYDYIANTVYFDIHGRPGERDSRLKSAQNLIDNILELLDAMP